jgi:hypothetical protein
MAAVWLVLAPAPAGGQTRSHDAPLTLAAFDLLARDAAATGAPIVMSAAALPAAPEIRRRPAALVPLYLTFGSLQVLDAHSTLAATAAGGSEQNPIVRPLVSTPAALVGVKAATATATIFVSEKLWRRHRGAALALMIAANAGYAAVVLHNYRGR